MPVRGWICCCLLLAVCVALLHGCPPCPSEGEGEGEGEGEFEGGNEGESEGEGEEPQPGEARAFANMEFVWIPAGTFQMGSSLTPEQVQELYGGSSPRTYENEHPRHPVTVSQGYWLGRYEVTQAQWEARMGVNPSDHQGPNLPVENISWDDCQAFINSLNSLAEGVFRLPYEAEWEYACRAGSETEFFFGDGAELLGDYAWYALNSAEVLLPETHPVGQKAPNAWGLYDTHGNVWEFCQDWYLETYYEESPEADPQGPDTGLYRVRRGGTALRSTAATCRSPFRSWNAPSFATADQGLRVLREAD